MAFSKKSISFALLLLLMMKSTSSIAASCDDYPGYTTNLTGIPQCKVDLTQFGALDNNARSEFGYESSDTNQQWPVCGKNRIAVSGDGNFTVTTASSSSFPNAVDASGGYQFIWSEVGGGPQYGFAVGSRCACLSDSITPRNVKYVASPGRVSSEKDALTTGAPRFYPSTNAEISQPYSVSNPYGPVVVSTEMNRDPRAYDLLFPSGGQPTQSACSCPNINEQAERIDTDELSGSVCKPMVMPSGRWPIPGFPDINGTSFPRVLATYKINDTFYSNQKLDTWKAKSDGLSGSDISQINLPTSSDHQEKYQVYRRRIWTCAAPYELNLASGDCVYSRSHHGCNSGGAGVLISPYVDAGPSPSAAGFDNLVNKKLACCLNSHFLDPKTRSGSADAYSKFDCIDNSDSDPTNPIYTNFDALWASADDDLDGGQLNAIVLFNGSNQPLTGFYSLNGIRCSDFSEFAGPLQPQQVDPVVFNPQQNNVGGSGIKNSGAPLPLPNNAAYTNLSLKVQDLGRRVPTTAQEMRSCPVLVRAAMEAQCPAFTEPPYVQITDPNDQKTKRCPVASSVLIHVRIEQLFSISGQATLKAVDSTLTATKAMGINISELITTKIGSACPPGTYRDGDLCVY
jgi:hypothetical protein